MQSLFRLDFDSQSLEANQLIAHLLNYWITSFSGVASEL